ncbi:MAG TPA: Rid family hydrolase [Chloroflexota bacterium]|jgi:hypothetical protein
MTERQIIKTDGAPTPTGPFNQAIRVGNLVYTSGQAGRNRDTGQMGVDADAAAGLHDPLEGGAAADVAVDLVATWAGGHRRGRQGSRRFTRLVEAARQIGAQVELVRVATARV